jgi:rod shape-determining protein MreD
MITLFLFCLAIMAGLIQVSLPFAYVPVDLVFLVVVFSGLQRGHGSGLATGILGGLLLDILVSPRLGPRLISCAMIGAIADTMEGAVNREQPRLQLLAVAALSLGHDMILGAASSAMNLNQGGWKRLAGYYILPRLAVHAGLAVPFYYLFRAVVRARVFQDPRMKSPLVIRKWSGKI